MKIVLNKNSESFKEIEQAVKDNDGYCPCKLEKTPDTKCICKEFRNQVKEGILGECHCGRWIAVEGDYIYNDIG